jgi:hypothetical protein
VAACLLMLLACTPKGAVTSKPGQPTPFPSNRFGPPAAAELSTLPFQPRSGTWEVTGRTSGDNVTPFKVVLVFQPNGLISVNGRQQKDEEAAKDPYARDFIARTATLGQEKITVTIHVVGQYTLTMTDPEHMDGVGMVRGETPAGVRLKWVSEATTPNP